MGSACCKNENPVDVDEINLKVDNQNGTPANGDVHNETETNITKTNDTNGSVEKEPEKDVSIEAEPPPETNKNNEMVILKAMYDYEALQKDDLGFKRDDRFEMLSEEGGWWYARHLDTGEKGYVPSTYVVKDDDNVTSYDWWFNMKRQDANKKLLLPGNADGTFLVRESSEKDTYALSIRWLDPHNPKAQGIRHYKIRCKDDKFHIQPKVPFSTVAKLINYYRENDGLVCKLLKACPNEPEPIPFKELEIERDSLVLSDKLGAGNFGEVFKGKWRRAVEVAVKTLKPNSMSPEAFLAEAEIMHKLRHHKLVLLMGICSKEEPMYIITELMVNGSLRDYLRDKKTELKFMTLIYMATQVAEGMAYLEEQKFVHRDVRAANMLVGENNITKVADFGLARVIDDDEYTAQAGAKFPVKWTAVEAINENNFSVKSDVWSFGVLLFELFTYGMTPYAGLTNRQTIDKVNAGYRMPNPAKFELPDDIYEKMQRCWSEVPEKRPAFKDLHPFFERYEEPNYELEGNEDDASTDQEDDANKYDD